MVVQHGERAGRMLHHGHTPEMERLGGTRSNIDVCGVRNGGGEYIGGGISQTFLPTKPPRVPPNYRRFESSTCCYRQFQFRNCLHYFLPHK